MRLRDQLKQNWRIGVALSIAGAMLVWSRFLDSSSVEWLSGMHAAYWVLCVIASFCSIALVLQEKKDVWHPLSVARARKVYQAQQKFARCDNNPSRMS
jgi:hypothetical protein